MKILVTPTSMQPQEGKVNPALEKLREFADELVFNPTGKPLTGEMQQLSAAEQCVCRRMLGEDVLLRSSEKTIANQQTSILKKLGLSSKKELCHIFSVY